MQSGVLAIQVRSENSVVLLCRDTAPSAPGLRELSLDLSLWQPLIEDRAFVPWLVRQPSEQVMRPGHERSSDLVAESAASVLLGSMTSVLVACRRWRARGT